MANELQLLVEQSGLEKSKAQYMLDNFTDDFRVAAEWEAKVKDIVVTDASQTGIMKMARAGRLFLRDRRIKVETARKHLKEQSLREGKAIDGIANVLKALIVPMEEHLYRQEHFIEIQLKAEAEQKRIEAEQQEERDRLAREKAEAEERERIRLENVRLQKEAEIRNKEMLQERYKRTVAEQKKKAAELKAKEIKAKAERGKKAAQAKAEAAKVAFAEAKAEKDTAELRANVAKIEAFNANKRRKEAEKQQKALREKVIRDENIRRERHKRECAEAEKQQAQAKADMEKRLAAERKEMEVIAERLRIHEEQKAKERAADYRSVVCPFCNGKFRIDSEGIIIT